MTIYTIILVVFFIIPENKDDISIPVFKRKINFCSGTNRKKPTLRLTTVTMDQINSKSFFIFRPFTFPKEDDRSYLAVNKGLNIKFSVKLQILALSHHEFRTENTDLQDVEFRFS